MRRSTTFLIEDRAHCKATKCVAHLVIDLDGRFLHRCDACDYEGALEPHFSWVDEAGRPLPIPAVAA